MSDVSNHEEQFWELAEPLLVQPAVTPSTMMGLPCLRTSGQFFASFDRRTGDLLVKLPEARVGELVEAGKAHDFAPAGRRFRQWAAIPPREVVSIFGVNDFVTLTRPTGSDRGGVVAAVGANM